MASAFLLPPPPARTLNLVSDRPITPYKPFDSRPKLLVAEPVDPFTGLPRIPRAGRMPSDVGELGDTDPESRDTELTPPDGPFAIRKVLKKLEKIENGFEEMRNLCRSSASNSMQMLATVQALAGQVDALKRRMDGYEVANRWMPRIVMAVTFAMAAVALARTYH